MEAHRTKLLQQILEARSASLIVTITIVLLGYLVKRRVGHKGRGRGNGDGGNILSGRDRNGNGGRDWVGNSESSVVRTTCKGASARGRGRGRVAGVVEGTPLTRAVGESSLEGANSNKRQCKESQAEEVVGKERQDAEGNDGEDGTLDDLAWAATTASLTGSTPTTTTSMRLEEAGDGAGITLVVTSSGLLFSGVGRGILELSKEAEDSGGVSFLKTNGLVQFLIGSDLNGFQKACVSAAGENLRGPKK
jgi:hypothetical protein